MSTIIDEGPLDTARTLEAVIRAHAEEAEMERRPSKPVVDALKEAGMFRLLTPQSLGGLEVDPLTCARVIEEISGFDSTAGWMLMTGNSVDWWLSRLPDEGAEVIYADGADIIIAAAFYPPIRGVASEGGYRITGRAPLASNIHDATWLLLNALLDSGDGSGPALISVILRADEAEIIETWDSLGMRGTDSNDVAVEDVFVPASRSYAMAPEFERGRHYRGPLYALPAMAEVAVVGAPVLLAIAQAAIADVRQIAQGKTPFGSTVTLRDRTAAQTAVARAEGIVRSARLLYYDTLAEAWARTRAGTASSLEQKADLMLAAVHAQASSVQAVDLMHAVAGTTGVYTRNPLERRFRDAHTLRHHGFFSDSRFETVGQVYLGVEPEFGIVAL